MIAIAPTDYEWYYQLSNELIPNEVNFWTPTPWNLRRLKEGDKFYFLLKAPYRKIGGYGNFAYYENMTAKEAWNRYGRGNGVISFAHLVERASKYAGLHSKNFIPTENPVIGCIVLTDLVFLDEAEYFVPADFGLSFPNEVVKIKYFNIDEINYRSQYQIIPSFELVREENATYRTSKTKDRPLQPKFRQEVLKAYDYRCAISGETCLEVLDAAHIQPYINEESNHIQNGIALRVDLHKLFDAGLITIDLDYKVVISPFLKSDLYSQYHGEKINLPKKEEQQPSKLSLENHSIIKFRG